MAKEEKDAQPDQCGNCSFGQDAKITRYDVKIIACRRFPPCQANQVMTKNVFPLLNETEWCGEHNRRPERKNDVEEPKQENEI